MKNGRIVTPIYNLVLLESDVNIPYSIIDLVQSGLPYPLSLNKGSYGINIDNTNISLSRNNNALTFNKDRIMYFSSIKQSLLLN